MVFTIEAPVESSIVRSGGMRVCVAIEMGVGLNARRGSSGQLLIYSAITVALDKALWRALTLMLG